MTSQIMLPPARQVVASDWNSQKLPGSSKAQVILDDTGTPWVVKSINSPQGTLSGDKASFNDYLAGRIAELVGFPVAEVGTMALDADFLHNYAPHLLTPAYGIFTPGVHFACRFYPGSFTLGDFAVTKMLASLQARCQNRDSANEVLAFDSSLANWDRSHTLDGFLHENLGNLLFQQTKSGLKLTMIDHGYSFCADWNTDVPPSDFRSVGDWPGFIGGLFKQLAKLSWYTEPRSLDGIMALSRITLRNIQDILDEIPSTWKRFASHADIQQMVICM
jgi:hypothetical protein